jgi:hypothetical protein
VTTLVQPTSKLLTVNGLRVHYHTFKPFGPGIVTGLDPTQFRIVVRHNGTLLGRPDPGYGDLAPRDEQDRHPAPGDVLWMGTEGADGDMVPGDVIEVEINGIGTLRNYEVAEA